MRLSTILVNVNNDETIIPQDYANLDKDLFKFYEKFSDDSIENNAERAAGNR